MNDLMLVEITHSLIKRGFLSVPECELPYEATEDEIVIQFLASIEEFGEIARHLRRYLTGVIPLDRERLGLEGADCLIATTNMATKIAGAELARLVRQKLAADELRGWRHTKGAAADTETVNRRAAAMAGIRYEGETTPDALAERIIELTERLASHNLPVD